MSLIATSVDAAAVDPLRRGMTMKPRGLWWDAWRRLRRNKAAVAGLIYLAIMFLIAIFAPLVAPYDPSTIPATARINSPPFWMTGHDANYLLGTDSLARDELSRLLYGARVSMVVGFVPTAITVLFGTMLGLLSGWLGGRVDNWIMRGVDVVYAFPAFLFFIVLQAALRQTWFGQLLGGLMLLFFAFAITGWVGLARLVRGQVLSIKEREYVEAARSIGVPTWRILLRHILPNTLAPIIVSISFDIPSYILAEAGLSFLGLGIQPPTASWGSMVFESFPLITFMPIFVIMPSLLIALIMIAFAFVGDGLRDALDPQMSR
ncbi:MAG TPA: ABC transporter permease [Thermomicrobiales bacterium]|nr:ABC transporter permease [Thermomicrobiales bacterium]